MLFRRALAQAAQGLARRATAAPALRRAPSAAEHVPAIGGGAISGGRGISMGSGIQGDPRGMFCNYELNMEEINWVGFDYDYTLAPYTEELLDLTYKMALDHLIKEKQYPESMYGMTYDPGFAIRGLHFDTQRGYLLKLDFLHSVYPGNVYFGRQVVSREEIVESYHGLHIPHTEMNSSFRPMADIFCLPEACLMADVIQHFVDLGTRFLPNSVYNDVRESVSHLHISGQLHNAISREPERYLETSQQRIELLQSMRAAGKKLFLLTNSPFPFVDAGMSYMVQKSHQGQQWRDLFDVIICSAKKPDWYWTSNPFRSLNVRSGRVRWVPVDRIQNHDVYLGGSLNELLKMEGMRLDGGDVLYLGDHVFADLARPTQLKGWRTGAIISELEREVAAQASPEYEALLTQVLGVEQQLRRLNEEGAATGYEQVRVRITELKILREQYRRQLKGFFNPTFGSVFRTHTGPTLFGLTIQRYSDIYTSRVENLLSVGSEHSFYPLRHQLPHEPWHECLAYPPHGV